MPIVAVPQYLGDDFRLASPGLRFGMFLKCWDNQFSLITSKKTDALKAASTVSQNDRELARRLNERQKDMFRLIPDTSCCVLFAKSIAPFTIGLGNEHPLENGFSFLNPYGLPYLPGSGVKGVIRQAARELASGEWGDACEWDHDMIDALFGHESGANNHSRGALEFWDVIPQSKDNARAVEIMTPHQKHYYQDNQSPHDSGLPNPICFLTVSPESEFTFYVRCDRQRLSRVAPDLVKESQWKCLLEAAFEHAFEWLGFGAKTAVGYGAMKRDKERERTMREEQKAREKREQEAEEREKVLAQMDPVERSIREFLDNHPNKQESETSAVKGACKQGRWKGEKKIEIAKWLQRKMKEERCWKESSAKRNPNKDRDYQDTLLVKTWLEGK